MTWKRRLGQSLALGGALAFVGAVTGVVLGEQLEMIIIMTASSGVGGAIAGLFVRVGQ